jgi:polyribonucleotide nucleotidyltransferase
MIINVFDDDVMPDALAGLAASAALALSDIPFKTLISEARVGRVDGNLLSIQVVHN